MSDLYERCPMCRGKPEAARCCCRGCQAKGFVSVGVTTKQLERLAQRHRLDQRDPPVSDPYLAALDAAELAIADCVRRPMGVEPESVAIARGLIAAARTSIGEARP